MKLKELYHMENQIARNRVGDLEFEPGVKNKRVKIYVKQNTKGLQTKMIITHEDQREKEIIHDPFDSKAKWKKELADFLGLTYFPEPVVTLDDFQVEVTCQGGIKKASMKKLQTKVRQLSKNYMEYCSQKKSRSSTKNSAKQQSTKRSTKRSTKKNSS